MSDLRYEHVRPLSTEDLIRHLESGDPDEVTKALYAATRYEQDWVWVQSKCLEGLKSSHVLVRWAAATCLGDLAFMRRPLDLDMVIPALEEAIRDPQIADPAGVSLSMVKEFLQ